LGQYGRDNKTVVTTYTRREHVTERLENTTFPMLISSNNGAIIKFLNSI